MGALKLKYYQENKDLESPPNSIFKVLESPRPRKETDGKTYQYGFQGQERDDEVSGSGNSYTAMYWQYDSRLGRRWNVDPKTNPSISTYAAFQNNPIMYTDPFGDSVKTSWEGMMHHQAGVNNILGDNGPFQYPQGDGFLGSFEGNRDISIDNNFDRSKYSSDQLAFIDGQAGVINSTQNNEIRMVDGDQVIPEFQALSNEYGNPNRLNHTLFSRGFNGATLPDGSISWVARNPRKGKLVLNPEYNAEILVGGPKQYIMQYSSLSLNHISLNMFHESGGHANFRFNKPLLSQPVHNDLVEGYETKIRKIFKVGVKGKKNNPEYMGGSAGEHPQ